MAKTIAVPVTLLEKMAEAGQAVQNFEDALEDFLIAENKPLLARIGRARAQHRRGEVRPFAEMRRSR